MKRGLTRAGIVVAALLALALAGRLVLTRSPLQSAPNAVTAKPPVPIPTLYCEFYNFMRSSTIVSFLFAVEQDAAGEQRFAEMAVVEPDGTRTEYEVGQRPQWTRATDDGASTIASSDGATRIVLYGFKPLQGGIFWTEAGVRSDTYKNLEGKCRQANFGAARGDMR